MLRRDREAVLIALVVVALLFTQLPPSLPVLVKALTQPVRQAQTTQFRTPTCADLASGRDPTWAGLIIIRSASRSFGLVFRPHITFPNSFKSDPPPNQTAQTQAFSSHCAERPDEATIKRAMFILGTNFSSRGVWP